MQTTHSLRKRTKQKLIFALHFLVLSSLPFIGFAQPVGANMNNPIVMGTYGTGTYSYSDTKNNCPASGYLNDYGQASDDIFYKFTVQGTTQITISHCGSGLSDTYMYLLDNNGNVVTYDDDNGPSCSSYQASISISLSPGTYYIVSEGYYTNCGSITTSVTMIVQPPPTPPDSHNFIKTWDATAPETDPNNLMTRPLRDVKLSSAYFDGLGRPEQTVIKKGSLTASANTDLVSPFVYDTYGREVQKYLPYVSPSNDGLYKTSAITEQNTFYTGSGSPVTGQSENYFYSKTDFESSPLNRVTKTYAPGVSWVGNNVGNEIKYWINTATDAVRIWNVTDNPGSFGAYTTATTYPAGTLFKNVTVDENLKQVIEFKDNEGKVILKKVQLTATADDGTGSDYTGWLCTYYIYDDLDNLRCVIQPEGVKTLSSDTWSLTTSLLNEQCFCYEYDQRNRMIMKKVPGAAEVYMVYDARDRLVMTQDGNLKTAKNGFTLSMII